VITRPEATRRSLVTHYCPVRCTPHYWQFIPPSRRVKGHLDGMGYISTFYYDLLADWTPKWL
jgi:hypothetical protein